MSNRPLRLVHASDLHLERPTHGVAEVPDALREMFLESPYLAAEQVFETVLAEDADMLLLAGDVVDPQTAGARAMVFLTEQFERLAQRDVQVYWAGGRVDPPQRVTGALCLPDNVHLFPAGRVEEFLHERDGEPIARVMGMSRKARSKVTAADFRPDPTGLFSIGVAYGNVGQAVLDRQRVNFLALGGRHARFMTGSAGGEAHYSGTPQGRCPAEVGPHGCNVLRVDEEGEIHSRFVTTDVMRWVSERIVVDEGTDRDRIEQLLDERMQALIEGSPDLDLLISWTVAGAGLLPRQLRSGALASELTDALRRQYGDASPAAWTVSLAAEPMDVLPPEWYDQETILGDFLRSVRQVQTDGELPIDFEPMLSERSLAGSVASAVEISDSRVRQHVLRQVALLGVDLLSAESEPSGEQEAQA